MVHILTTILFLSYLVTKCCILNLCFAFVAQIRDNLYEVINLNKTLTRDLKIMRCILYCNTHVDNQFNRAYNILESADRSSTLSLTFTNPWF